MPERDLKLICDSIPCSSTGDVSTQASAIYKGISGSEVEFDIQTGGEQPQLFAPVINVNGYIYSISNDSRNGGFASDSNVNAAMNDVPIALSGTLTDADDGKVMEATVEATNFESNTATVTIAIPSNRPGVWSTSELHTNNSAIESPGFIVLGRDTKFTFSCRSLTWSDFRTHFEWSNDGGVTWNQPTASFTTGYIYGIIIVPATKDQTGQARHTFNGDLRIRVKGIANSTGYLNFFTNYQNTYANCVYYTRLTPGTLVDNLPKVLFYCSSQSYNDPYFSLVNWSSAWTGEAGAQRTYSVICGFNNAWSFKVRRLDTLESVTTLRFSVLPADQWTELQISMPHSL